MGTLVFIDTNIFLDSYRLESRRPGLSADGIPPIDPSFQVPDIDDEESLFDELERVWPTPDRPEGWGLVFSTSKRAVIRHLQQQPDRYGSDGIQRALHAARFEAER